MDKIKDEYSDELKRCPFCGSEPTWEDKEDKCLITCLDCKDIPVIRALNYWGAHNRWNKHVNSLLNI